MDTITNPLPPFDEPASDALQLPELAGIDLQALVGHGLGPAWIVNADGTVLAQNEAALMFHSNAEAWSKVETLARNVLDCQEPAEQEIVVDGSPRRFFLVRARPVWDSLYRGCAWLEATETSIKDHLIQALRISRAMFKDLAEAAGDFAWATDSAGRFTYVSANGQFDLSPWALNGRYASELSPEAGRLFTTRIQLDSTDVWVNVTNDVRKCLSLVALPIFENNKWVGARGIARDVTEDRLAQQYFEAARRQEVVYQGILEAIRSEADPSAMLATAVQVIGDSFEADRCLLVRPNATVVHGDGDGAVVHTLKASCKFRDRVTAELVVERQAMPWTEEEQAMLTRIADPVAVAIAQADQLEAAERLSLTDWLTGLGNRRAFEEEVGRRLAALSRSTEQTGVLMLIDLDHFKQLNDTQGHDAGDEALRQVAELLRAQTRASDLAARLGGDEFALWLDQANLPGGERVAMALKAAMAEVRVMLKTDQLSLSMGLASWRPGDSLAELFKRADEALYCVKRRGRDGHHVAKEER